MKGAIAVDLGRRAALSRRLLTIAALIDLVMDMRFLCVIQVISIWTTFLPNQRPANNEETTLVLVNAAEHHPFCNKLLVDENNRPQGMGECTIVREPLDS